MVPILEMDWKKVTQAFHHDSLHPYNLINPGDKSILGILIVPGCVVPEVETWMSWAAAI